MAKMNMLYRGTNKIKYALVKVLRDVFADPTIVIDERYRYIPSMEEKDTWDKTSKISIYRSYPKRIEVYPAITISSGAYVSELMTLSDEKEVAMEHFNNNGVLESISYVGHSIVPITIDIRAKGSTDDREVLTDIIVMILRILGRGRFAKYGFAYNKIEVGGETEDTGDDGEIIYGNSITINCNTDYWYIFDENQADLINAVGVKVFGQVSSTSPDVLLHPD